LNPEVQFSRFFEAKYDWVGLENGIGLKTALIDLKVVNRWHGKLRAS
jgi:hypothetical protein